MSVVAVELYVEIEGLLGNKLFLATELSSVGPVAYEVLSFLLLCGLADKASYWFDVGTPAARTGEAVRLLVAPLSLVLVLLPGTLFHSSSAEEGWVSKSWLVLAETIEATVWLSSCVTRSEMVNPCGRLSAVIWWPNG